MKRVAVLGVTGMLGHTVARVLQAYNFNVVGVSRSYWDEEKFPWGWRYLEVEHTNILGNSIRDAISGAEWVVNCIGVIKPHIDENSQPSVCKGIIVNSIFPHILAQVAGDMGIKVIQIATDCVFSGERGGYTETEAHDAVDVYGRSKSLGEVVGQAGFVNLRCSIIGPELGRKSSLLEWVRGQKLRAKIEGYENHYWNGLTTFAFAKICRGVILQDHVTPDMVHVVPKGNATKYELVKMLAHKYGREDISIIPTKAPKKINRSLNTIYPEVNERLWEAAGYASPPSISQMIEET